MSENTQKEGKFKNLWRRPRFWFLFGIPAGGFLMFAAGIIFWGGFNTALEATNSLGFCTSCHQMDTVFKEYKTTVHYQNASGVRAICPDCHVPKQWGPKVWAKAKATMNELPKTIFGVMRTPEEFEAKRLELAEDVWAGMKATNSRECRNCHAIETMKLDKQDRSARKKHNLERMQARGETCIDCHKGIAHHLPKGYEG